MKVALLSAGPSLQASYGPAVHDHDLTIGVNTAVQFFPCDWWACADRHRFVEIDKYGVKTIGKKKKLPKLFMIDAQLHDARCYEANQIDRYDVTGWNDVYEATGASKAWADRTATSALILAKHLGATELDVFGVDMDGHLDCTREITDSTKYREPTRWLLERQMWTLIRGWIEARGVKVSIHAPQLV